MADLYFQRCTDMLSIRHIYQTTLDLNVLFKY